MEEPGFRSTIPPALHPLLDNWHVFAKNFQVAEAAVL